MQKSVFKKTDLIFPNLSYRIVGVLYDVYNEIGGGYREKYYQKALSVALNRYSIKYKEQIYYPISYQGIKIGSQYLDFLIEDKIVLEIKSGEKFVKNNIQQVYSYLKSKKLKLGILANFTKTGVRFRRILNIK